ncbi:MAG: hypothetical protein KDD44_02350 [Bdellovibrionales bacterium]|nr:hypothetical protein [Bdellovibrionales bacterium]
MKNLFAFAVHCYTACGAVIALLVAQEIIQRQPSPTLIFILFAIAIGIDATDGPLARKFDVKTFAPAIDGRRLDDIIDYLNYTFLPLLLLWRMGWVTSPALLWLAPALVASALGFSNINAKFEDEGFFLGFPSYWNVAAWYAAVLSHYFSPVAGAILVLALAALTLAPIRFVYPNRAPQPEKSRLIIGAVLWGAILLWSLRWFPAVPEWLFALSLLYPVYYCAASYRLARLTFAKNSEQLRVD